VSHIAWEIEIRSAIAGRLALFTKEYLLKTWGEKLKKEADEKNKRTPFKVTVMIR